MKLARGFVPLFLSGLVAAPLFAQTTIGAGSCSSANLSGTYAMTISGRQVTSAGRFTAVLQANGSATFDGLSKVTISLSQDTAQAAGTPLNWGGTYSMQANCVGTLTVTTGGSGTFNLVLFNDAGLNFLLTGSDATYSYSGNGNLQPATCSTSMLVGVYTVNATGFSLASGAVSGATSAVGLVQFDGTSNVTANLTSAGTSPAGVGTLTGTYSVSSNCLGSATLTDSKGGSYTMNLSISGANKVASTALFLELAQSGTYLISGAAHAIFGQPSPTALALPTPLPDPGNSLEKLAGNKPENEAVNAPAKGRGKRA